MAARNGSKWSLSTGDIKGASSLRLFKGDKHIWSVASRTLRTFETSFSSLTQIFTSASTKSTCGLVQRNLNAPSPQAESLILTWAWCLSRSRIWSARRSSTCGRRRCSARRSFGGTPPTWGAPPLCGTVNDKVAGTLNQRSPQLTDSMEWLVVIQEQPRMIDHPHQFLIVNSSNYAS